MHRFVTHHFTLDEVVCSEHDITGYGPARGLLPLDQAITLALRYTRGGAVSTR